MPKLPFEEEFRTQRSPFNLVTQQEDLPDSLTLSSV